MRAIVLTVLGLFGCQGAIPPRAPEPAHQVPPEAEPEHQAPPEAGPEHQVEPPRNPLIVGGPGFWCAARSAESQTITECFRTQEGCTVMRGRAQEREEAWTECAYREQAICFAMKVPVHHNIGFRCYGESSSCDSERERFRRKLPEEDVLFTDCSWSASIRGRVRPPYARTVSGRRTEASE